MKMKQLQKMMQQAQSMQAKLETEMNEMTVEATSGGGMVTVCMDGKKNVKSIRLSKEAVDPDDVELLEDMILAALHEASAKVDEVLQEQIGSLGGGLLGGL
ncbi:MAG: YbaB/EbfC family nucleoid-associated protein [Acidobacteriota bacterium]|nr:MAG: YbaB/EbfC family nucleoid-associated protein [Acidobacteriota bacterium]